MNMCKLTSLATIALLLLSGTTAMAAIELVTVTKATQKDCKLSFTIDIQPHPNGSGAKQVTLVIPAKQVEALHVADNSSYGFFIRDGNKTPLSVPLALTKQRDGSLKTQITVADEVGMKAWFYLHVWLSPDGSGTAFSVDLGSYLAEQAPAKKK